MSQVAQIIMNQLDWPRFRHMVGAKYPLADQRALQFKFAKSRNRDGEWVNTCRIELNGKDLYDVKFFMVSSMVGKEVKSYGDVDCENLVRVFESGSGMYARL